MNRWTRWGLVAAVNVVLALLAAEATVRVAAHLSRGVRRLVFQRTAYAAGEIAACGTVEELLDRDVWWPGPFARCHGYVLNSKGFRTSEYVTGKAPGVRRVVLLGDSFLVEAGGVRDEDHVATRFAAELKGTAPVEVVNLGVSGCGTHFQLRLLELEGLGLHPDDVVLFLFIGNDLTDEPAVLPAAPAIRRWLGRSAVVRFARNLRRMRGWQAALASGGTATVVPPLAREAHLALVAEKGRIYGDPWPGDLEADWRSVAGALGRMRDETKQAGARLLLVLIPDETQIEPPLQDVVAVAYPGTRLDFGRPQRIIAGFCRDAGIPVLDLLPAFRRARAAGSSLYMPRDTHWNPAGQRLAASLIARKLAGVSGGRAAR